MELNPEFRRNLWLEMTTHRLVGMPLAVGAVTVLLVLINRDDPSPVAIMALVAFGALAFLWGARNASESIMTEIKERTWDGQRMSVIGPWSMTWGKLLGSTIYTWYGGAMCIFIFMLATTGTVTDHPVRLALFMVLCGLLAQSLGFLSTLLALRKNRDLKASHSTAFMVVAVMVALQLTSVALAADFDVKWYGVAFGRLDFFIGTAAVYMGWTVFGSYRLMRLELQMKGTPAAWVSFIFFLIFYFSGFFDWSEFWVGNGAYHMELVTKVLVLSFVISLAASYLMLFTESKDPIRFRKLFKALDAGDRWEALTNIPAWMATAPLVAVFAVAIAVTGGTKLTDFSPGGAFVVAMSFFFLRDAALLLYLNLAADNKRADIAAVVYFILLYGVVPGIFSAGGMETATALFWPYATELSTLSVAAAAFEALIVLFFLYKRWQKNYGFH